MSGVFLDRTMASDFVCAAGNMCEKEQKLFFTWISLRRATESGAISPGFMIWPSLNTRIKVSPPSQIPACDRNSDGRSYSIDEHWWSSVSERNFSYDQRAVWQEIVKH